MGIGLRRSGDNDERHLQDVEYDYGEAMYANVTSEATALNTINDSELCSFLLIKNLISIHCD